jgi:hypothetical protein
LNPLVVLDLTEISTVISFFSSVAIILGSVFVVLQIRQNSRLIAATRDQAVAAAAQAKLATEEIKQNNELADMDMIMRLYEFANTAEVQSAWLSVLNSKLASFEEFERLPKAEQVSYYQIASLFESLGVLVDRGLVKPETIDDMFQTKIAWESMRPFLDGVGERLGEERSFTFFEKLYKVLSSGTAVQGAT